MSGLDAKTLQTFGSGKNGFLSGLFVMLLTALMIFATPSPSRSSSSKATCPESSQPCIRTSAPEDEGQDHRNNIIEYIEQGDCENDGSKSSSDDGQDSDNDECGFWERIHNPKECKEQDKQDKDKQDKDKQDKKCKEDPGGFEDHRQSFLLDTFWKGTVRPTLKSMTAQYTSVAYQQMAIIGSFFDATIQQESQLALQELQAEAVKDYAPSKAMCSMGTATRSLAASEAKSRANQIALSARGMQRQLGTANTIASGGPSSDKRYRANQFIDTYCATADNNNGLGQMCGSSAEAHNQNMDVDFIRTIAAPMTIKMDLTNDKLETSGHGADEEDVMALASNLYAHDVFEHISRAKLRVSGNQESYLEMRGLAAKRNVAMNSYNAIAGMKASGSGASDKYLENMARQLGVEDDKKLDKYLGENPSYYAQMEFLTKKLYQDPAFVTKLVDRPANVKRQQAAMLSFELMQQRDIYKSMKRSEMLLSVLLELQLMKNQEQVEDSIRGITQTTGGG